MTSETEIPFQTKISISYQHIIKRGAFLNIGNILRRWVPSHRPIVVLSDTTVASLYWQSLKQSLEANNWPVPTLITFDASETSKSFETYQRILDEMFSKNVHRQSVLINFGGGITCDLGGFVASSYMRGLDYINIPTSLMGQVDAGVGGKVAINLSLGKNLVGSFYHPISVIIDPDLIKTLPALHCRNGLAEVIKVALISSPKLFEFIEKNAGSLVHNMRNTRQTDYLISEAVKIKVNLLKQDPFESNLQRVLNFGHTFAHPIEAASNFTIPHGYAVAIGMSIATRIALNRNYIPFNHAKRILKVINKLGLPVETDYVDPNTLWNKYTQVVKSTRADNFYFVLPTSIGSVKIVNDLRKNELIRAFHSSATNSATESNSEFVEALPQCS